MRVYKDELRAKKQKRFIIKTIFIVLIFFVLLDGIFYLLFFAKLFNIRSLSIDVPEDSRDRIEESVAGWLKAGFWEFTRNNNIFFVSSAGLKAQLINQFPNLETVQVSSKFPHSFSVSATARKPIGVWCLSSKNQCFYFDKYAIAFVQTQPSNGYLLINVNDKRSRELKLGETVSSREWYKSIILVRDMLYSNGINISEFSIPVDSFDEFDAKTSEGWSILLSNQTDLVGQINSLNQFLKEKITPEQRKGLQYVDLRIQDRVYYK